MNVYMLLMFGMTFLTAISQVLLKKSANQTYKSWIYEYLNWRVIVAYGIFFGVLLVNTYAYTQVDMKYGAVIDTFSYVFVMVLSWLLLRERFTRRKVLGNLVIMVGVLIYTLPRKYEKTRNILYKQMPYSHQQRWLHGICYFM